MKLFRVLVLAVALIAGGVAAFLALNLQPSAPVEAVVELAPQIQSQDVLVAKANIGQGQKLTAENIGWQPWPDEAVNPAYIQRAAEPEALEKLLGSVVRSPFVAGEPIRHAKLARPDSGFLSAILPPGKRAVAVRISAQNTAGGFILPNDRVDVIQTITEQNSTDTQPSTVSRTILTNVKVLAIDQTIDDQGAPDGAEGADAEIQADTGEAVVIGKTATLELDPKQVELVTAAEAAGTLSLALRSFADLDQVGTTAPDPEAEALRRRLAELEAENRNLKDQPAPQPPVVAAPAEPQSSNIRIFRSGRRENVTLE